ncbi:ABC transporter ATP-binding protein [Kingella kingae]|uniref:ABC transporter ATP-binding protein n=1 Tax=Kingella kingae TaxID=504 RepID=UPI00040B6452|nr:ABC transporter ATP-binding protein [Kingella kingae]
MRYPFSTGLFNMLNIQSLYFSYDDRIVLHDINVQLDEGSITGLIGPNGAGKSTLMRCMAGLEVPSDGEVFLNGKPILDDPRTSFAQLGYLPDFFGLPPDLSVIQCLTYAAKSRGLPDNKLAQTIGETVELLGLQDKLYHKIGALSRGQKQRVGIGQVIVHRPKFLLLDEPASGLDPEARHELSLLLLRLKAEGMTILVSSHILSELDEYCTHMLVIKSGRIQAHQALNAADPIAQTQQTITLHFVGNARDYLPIVQALPNVQAALVQENNAQSLLVTLPNGDDVRVALLRDIVQAAFPLSEAQRVKTTMLQSYQNSLNTAKKGEA